MPIAVAVRRRRPTDPVQLTDTASTMNAEHVVDVAQPRVHLGAGRGNARIGRARPTPSNLEHARQLTRSAAAVKRTADIVIGGVLCVVTLPVVVVLCVGSILSFKCSPFFVQTRVGRHGHLVRVLKIRSLPAIVGSAVSKYELDTDLNTRFGRIVRRTHADELPQLWLVLVGKMSLVGPRPEMPHLAEQFRPAQTAARVPFRAGCTGLWQLSEDAPRLMNECPEYDIFYARHQSLRLDLWILWRTFTFHVFGWRLSLGAVPRWIAAPESQRDTNRSALAS